MDGRTDGQSTWIFPVQVQAIEVVFLQEEDGTVDKLTPPENSIKYRTKVKPNPYLLQMSIVDCKIKWDTNFYLNPCFFSSFLEIQMSDFVQSIYNFLTASPTFLCFWRARCTSWSPRSSPRWPE